jgi:uncharacterized protein DUF4440
MLCASLIFGEGGHRSVMRGSRRIQDRKLAPLCSFVSFVVLALCLSACTIGKEPKHPTWKNATGAEQYERLMWQAVRDKDWKDVEYRLASTFVGVNPQGAALDRAGWVEYWKASPVTDFAFGELTVQPNGADMTVTYVLRLNARASGSALRVISIWQENKGGWMLIATSTTPLLP